MSLRRFLLAMLLCLVGATPVSAQPRGVDGIALTKVPAVVIVVSGDKDARVPLVREGVTYWNKVLAGIGSGFRLGAVSIGNAGLSGEPGKIVVVLSDDEFISHVRRLPNGQGAVAMIRNDRGPPMSRPNVARNVIAHELGHAIGLGHNSDPAMLMCGRPASCRPGLFASSTPRYFPLSGEERSKLLAMYPPNWKSQ